MTKPYDIVVIGGGPAGYVAAIKGSQLGGRVALVERDELGGTCLNHGCIPTKTWLHNAEIIRHIREAGKRGITLADSTMTVDMPKTVAAKNRVVKRLTTGVKALLKSHSVDIIKATGQVTPDLNVELDGGDILTTKNVICATGSRPGRLPIDGIDGPRVLDSDTILDLQELPGRLAILGGGVIGIEMARIFAAFGSQVSIVELEQRIAPFLDEELSSTLTKSLKRQGIAMHTGVKVTQIEDHAGQSVTLHANEPNTDKTVTIEADYVLVAVGRQADTAALTQVADQLQLNIYPGTLHTGPTMQSLLHGLYVPGDVNRQCMLAHAAMHMGEVAAISALGYESMVDLRFVPGVIYGSPEVAYIGMTEAEAIASDQIDEIRVGRYPIAANGRSLCAGENEGMVKTIVDYQSGRLLGAHIMSPGASELINEAAVVMKAGLPATQLAHTMHAHPTVSESLMEATADAFGQCVHLPPK